MPSEPFVTGSFEPPRLTSPSSLPTTVPTVGFGSGEVAAGVEAPAPVWLWGQLNETFIQSFHKLHGDQKVRQNRSLPEAI
jgi:hypothetical protein